jgi:lysozyme
MMHDAPPPIIKQDEDLELGKVFTRENEGLRLKMYLDTAGKATIGYGHNLDAKAISRRAAEVIFEDDYADALADARTVVALAWDNLSPARRAALIDMAFQLGKGGLLGFRRMRAAIARGNWGMAAAECLDSRYGREQTPKRARRVARMLETGEWL